MGTLTILMKIISAVSVSVKIVVAYIKNNKLERVSFGHKHSFIENSKVY